MGQRGPQKGQRYGGRQKGTPNKIPRNLKDKILHIVDILEDKGIGLDVQAESDPKWFFENFLKPMLPKNIALTGEEGGPIQFSETERAARIAAILDIAGKRKNLGISYLNFRDRV